MRTRVGAQQTWTSRQVVFVNEMKSVASDALENRRRSLLSEATAPIFRQSHQHLQEYQQSVQRQVSEVQ